MGNNVAAGKHGAPWTREELILAFDLYCRIPFSKTKATNPAVRELANLLQRSPGAVARKLGNFGAFDPELRSQGISGLAHGSRLDREIWDEFHTDWGGLVYEAHNLRQSLANREFADSAFNPPGGPSERVRLTKQRVHQAFFRDSVLSNYEGRCCITGVTVVECLVASHIIPWSCDERHRVDPTNGLCLSATFDRLFDSGLITIAADLTLCVSPRVREPTNHANSRLIACYHGKPITRPHRFLPSQDHLEWHRTHVFMTDLYRSST